MGVGFSSSSVTNLLTLTRANANVIPSAGWCLIYILGDKNLTARILEEISPCFSSHLPESVDLVKLNTCPLLQSVVAEVLRLNVTVMINRVRSLQTSTERRELTLPLFTRLPLFRTSDLVTGLFSLTKLFLQVYTTPTGMRTGGNGILDAHFMTESKNTHWTSSGLKGSSNIPTIHSVDLRGRVTQVLSRKSFLKFL
jgi:hypothetical protein